MRDGAAAGPGSRYSRLSQSWTSVAATASTATSKAAARPARRSQRRTRSEPLNIGTLRKKRREMSLQLAGHRPCPAGSPVDGAHRTQPDDGAREEELARSREIRSLERGFLAGDTEARCFAQHDLAHDAG